MKIFILIYSYKMKKNDDNKKRLRKNLDLVDWIKEFDENNIIDDDIESEKSEIFNKTMENDIHNIFFEKFLPNFSERLNLNSSSDIYDYEDFFSKPVANPFTDKNNYKEYLEKDTGNEQTKKKKQKEQEIKNKSNRFSDYYTKKKNLLYNN